MKLCGVCGSPNSAPPRVFCALLCVLFAAGCAPRTAQNAGEIKFAGVATVRSSAAPARRAKMIWTRFQDGGLPRDTVDIKTPFGITQARLEIDADGMRILVGGRDAKTENAAPDVREWLESLPPPHSIGYWLAGESDPAYSAREIFVPGEPGVGRIHQHEWEVEYAERDENGRPSRIRMRPRTPPPLLPDAEAEVWITKWLAK
ncbi:MAG: lipoprotein insertase outer membrane protein LolB [Gammaproteobacteria bacterium]